MKFKTYQYSKHWTETVSTSSDDAAVEAAKRAGKQLESILSSTLLSENLVILTGLGTSLCIKDSAGNALAPTMPDLWKAIKAATPDFDTLLARVQQPKDTHGWKEDVELLLSRCQMAVVLNSDAIVQAFIDKAEALIADKCGFLKFLPVGTGLPIHEAFLRKLAQRPTRLPRAKLFTTNYDLCFESAAGSAGFVLIDGFSHASPQVFDGVHFSYDIVRRDSDNDAPTYIPNTLQLLKLHGSVDWERDSAGMVRRVSHPAKPVIIYPKNGKFESSFSQPYFEMMARFQSALRMPNAGLLVVGFGFNDAHLVGPIESSLRSNSSLKMVVVGPSYESKMPDLVTSLEKLIEAGDRRLTIVAAGFEDLVSAIPDLKAPSEDELHTARIRQVINK
ncbi:SIR2-like domain-containing protein [Granulicella rosea]|uniref:SIR2-like domain-containing protein n=1 Tax=Granulicella rosea TaxID=474952 RepID=A0A239HFK5_9BACT|nr:SIR2 family protein [Granulicella rosea]SNS80137.1 SIR2-like domain-containing protein [Granulicella rosea]